MFPCIDDAMRVSVHAMPMITDTKALAAFCQRLSTESFITVDTEFMRERTYWSQLCLIQVAGSEEAYAIDPLAPGMDLTPLFELFANEKVLKVFHAARQDLEIFLQQAGALPKPLFDTQVAAMVCGFGDSIGYEPLAAQLANAKIDKSMRFTDWSLRPLSEKQIKYALADVTHLRVIYEKLYAKLEANNRASWLDDELAELTSPDTYRTTPEDSWKRLKSRSGNAKFLNVLREVAAWREREAQERDIPRQRILRDEAIMEIAANHPTTIAELSRTRGLGKGMVEGKMGAAIMEAVAKGLAAPEDQAPKIADRIDVPRSLGPVIELLKVLLKMKCDQHEVAQKLIAGTADIEAIAVDDNADVPALKGWRREVFGQDALRLKHGGVGLAFCTDGRKLRLIPLDGKE
jgi:ribonuclease D